MIVNYLSELIIFFGIFFIFSATLGLIRFSSFFTRVHAAGLCDAFGAPLVLIGFAIKNGLRFDSLKIILLIIVIWITSTTTSYILCKSKMIDKNADFNC